MVKVCWPGWHEVRLRTQEAYLSQLSRMQRSTESAIVAVNNGANAANQTFTISSTMGSSVTPWITSNTQSLAPQVSIQVSSGSFTYAIPALSIVTSNT